MVENPQGQEEVLRREYSRVDIYVPFEFRAIAPEEREHIRARVSGNAPGVELRPLPDLGEHDQIFSEWLKMLSAKLDTIIRLITLQKEGYFGLTPKAVNISGGGLSFSAPQGIALGEILEIKMMLTLQQPIAIALYGEVVKSVAHESGHIIAVRYVQMDEAVRDEIIRFVFEREREIIREKRR